MNPKKLLLTILAAILPPVFAYAATVPATLFPDDGSTATYVTPDGLVSFTTSNFFSREGNYVGDGGGSGNKTNTWDGAETLEIALTDPAGLSGFSLRWTRADIVVQGFDSDPGAVIAGVGAGVTWDGGSGTLTLAVPWDAGTERDITFSDPLASRGRTLNISFAGSAGYQATFTAFHYATNATPQPHILSFKAIPQNRVPSGTPVTLSWETENATQLTLDPGGIVVTGLTSYVVNPTSNTTYTLTAGDGMNPDVQDTVVLAVGPAPYPNIIVFFLDDFGWSDWEQNGAPTGSVFHETPNMNQLTAEGLYFPNGYASTPVCSPTRSSLLTGQSPAFSKVTDWISGSGDAGKPIRQAEWVKNLPLTTPTFARVLSDSGYRSIHVGKWHLGQGGMPAADPLNHGFDINIGGNLYGTPPGPERYFASSAGFSGLPNLGPAVAPAGSYLTDVLTEQAVERIRTAAGEGSAFVMYLSHYAVHTPIQAPAVTVQKYQDKLANNPGMDWQGQTNPTYAAMVEHVDRSLGEVLAALEDPDENPGTNDSIADNTLVVFTADNGGLIGVTSNRPLRDGKGGNYEGGIREPWVFWWPGTIAPGTNSEPIISHDLFPTLLAQAGVPTPAGHTVNGQDLSPLLSGGDFARVAPLVFHYPHWSPQGGSPYSAIRYGKWKLVYDYAGAGWELYDLDSDIGESTNRITVNADHHAVLSWMLANGLELLDANYPRNVGTLAEEPPVPLVTPHQDQDGDGVSDLDETVHGTELGDPQAYFNPIPQLETNTFTFSFTGSEHRTYALQSSATLASGSWQEIETFGPLASGQAVILSDTNGPQTLPHRMYRVSTDLLSM